MNGNIFFLEQKLGGPKNLSVVGFLSLLVKKAKKETSI